MTYLSDKSAKNIMPVSIIIPVLNEEKNIKVVLQQLQRIRSQGNEVIVVDGGSQDQTCLDIHSLADSVISSEPGRAIQMNHGALHAKHGILWFLHADSLIVDHAVERIQTALSENRYHWGRFNLKLTGSNRLFRIIETMMNIRSSMTGIATGDQGIFVNKEAFETVKGFSEIPLMEDIDLCKKLKKISRPYCLKENLISSSRRWEKNGILSTIFLMWRLRFLYFVGISADTLARQYR